MKKLKTVTLTECALMVALSAVLGTLSIFKMPNGGSITLGGEAPIIIVSLRHGAYYGLISGFVYALVQIFTGFHPPPAKNIYSYILVILLDYIIPCVCLGSARFFYDNFKHHKILCSSFAVMFIRYVSLVMSGVIIWKDLFPPTAFALQYSAIYNCTYMIPETIITCLVCLIIHKHKMF